MMASDPETLFRAGRSAQLGKNDAEARRLYQQVMDEYPQSRWANEARAFLDRMDKHTTIARIEPTSGDTNMRARDVRVIDVDIAFTSMVWLFVKAAIATIPAAIILAVLGIVAYGLLAALSRQMSG